MSHTLQILKLMSDGNLYTARQMAALLNLSISQVYRAMACLRKNKAMRATDQPYAITDHGRDWLWNREAKARRVAANKARPKRPMGRPRLHPRAEEPIEPEEPPFEHRTIAAPARDASIAQIVKNNPLHAAWGNAHA